MSNAPIDYPINLVFIVIGLFLGLTLGAFLLFNKSSKSLANIFLGGIVLCMTTTFFTGFLFRFDLLDSIPHVVGMQRYTRLLYGPLAYFFVLASTQKGFTWNKKMFIHFIPFAIFLIADYSFIVQSGAEKLDYYHTLIETGDIGNSKFIALLLALHGITYYVLAAQKILQYRNHVVNSASTIDEGYHRWVLMFITILGTAFLSLMIFVFFEYNRIFIFLVFLCYVLCILSIYFGALLKPKLFHHFPHQMPLPASNIGTNNKYETSNLSEDKKQLYVQKLDGYMKTHKPYLEPELTLSHLADQIEIPSHYLSQIVNEKLGQNFLDYINNHRIEEAKMKLIDANSQQFTILSIAFDAGFNSKSTFYSAFKKATGMTPNQFRNSKKQ